MKKLARKSGQLGQIRIIGGQWRGRKLPVPNSEGLRPTTDLVRETLFNWLAPWLPQAHCLDCFAGSGALGLEALSRYAAKVVLIEQDGNVVRQLQQNVSLLNAQTAEVVRADTLNWLAKTPPTRPFDIVFIDPPFRRDLLNNTLNLLESQQWLAAEAMIYTESEVEHGPLKVPTNWILDREKTAGQVCYRLYRRQSPLRERNAD